MTFTEVASYVRASVNRDTAGRQNPTFSGLGDVPLAVVGEAGAGASGGGGR